LELFSKRKRRPVEASKPWAMRGVHAMTGT
jgi:hypothetical protein